MFDNISKNWRKDKLKNILDILRNGANIKQLDNANGIPISRIETIANGYVDFNKVGYANVYDDKYKDYYIQKGDILLSHINSVAHLGKCAFCNFDSKLIHGMNLLLLRANQNILPKFLYYLLNSQILKKQLPSITKKSVNQASMSTTNLGNLNVIYPINKNEQQEIVDVLDAASEIIRLRKECIKSAQSLIPALFQEMFGDPLSKVDKNKIGYYFDVGTGATPRRENSEYYEGNIPWVKTTEVDNCYINSTSEHISESAIKETNCSLYPPGTILMAMYGQGKTRGKVAYLNISATTNQACAALQLKKEYENDVNLIYVFYYLQIIYEFLRTLSQGGGRPNMNLSIVRNIPLYLPDIKQQELFAEKVQEIEEYIKSQQAELENAKIMFQSLLHHSFTGELTRRAYEK